MDSKSHRAIQIMDFEVSEDPAKPREIKFYKDNLQSVLCQAGDRKICIISIAGPSRKGKSFFLSFLIRYLDGLEKHEPDWLDYENSHKPLSGFKWTTDTKHETSGMLCWSKLFVVKSKQGDIAVMLVDTQGTYDKSTTPRERSAIVGLSLLTSSCLIFNFCDMLQEDCLESLHTYVNYGLMAMNPEEAEADRSTHPFQRLYFLIRDWRMPTKHKFGAQGGSDYLKSILEIDSLMPPNVRQVREMLQKCFDRMDCFLMPGLGERAQKEGFNGCLSQLSEIFTTKLVELVEDLLKPDTIPVKSVFGNQVTAADVLSYFEQYVNIFNCEDTPAPVTLMEATANIAFQNLVTQCFKKYEEGIKQELRGKKFLPDSALIKVHKEYFKLCGDHFKNARKMGTPDSAKPFLDELITHMTSHFNNLMADNEKKRDRFIEDSKSEALSSFRESMEKEFPDEEIFVDSNKLKVLSDLAKTSAISSITDMLAEKLDAADFQRELQMLEAKVNEEETRVIIENQNRQMKAEKKLNDLLEGLVSEYSKIISKLLSDNPFIDEEELLQLMQNHKNEISGGFITAEKTGGKIFIQTYANKLEEMLERAGEEALKSYKLKVKEAEKQADSVVAIAIEVFEEQLAESVADLWEDSELQLMSDELRKQSLQAIQDKLPIPKEVDLAQKILSKAEEQLKASSLHILKNYSEFKRECEESYSKAAETSFEFYANQIDEYLDFPNKRFRTVEELQIGFEDYKAQAVETYHMEPKIGNHPNPQHFLDQLENKIKVESRKIEELNNSRSEVAAAEVKNFVNEMIQKYKNDMVKFIDSLEELADLENQHELSFQEAQQDLLKKYSDGQFTEPFLMDLEEEILKAYNDDVKYYWELKQKERNNETNNALIDARRIYKEEMEKHFKGNLFVQPVLLENLHQRLFEEAIEKCEETTPLTDTQKQELKSALLITYEQYKEVNAGNVPNNLAIGIDLGTTYSCVAVYVNGEVKIILNNQGTNITPSYVCYSDDNESTTIVGQPAKSKAYENAENTIYDAKRIIGRDMNDNNLQKDMEFWPFKVVEDKSVPKIQINSGKLFFPEQVSSEILKEMRSIAEDFLGCEVKKAVITVPAYFNDGQRQATIDAGKLAGLEVLTILNEPTSAAIAYKLHHSEDHFRHVLVYDLGGGTFDVAVLKIGKGNIENLALGGDTHLGGQDFDQNVMEYCCHEFKKKEGIDLMEGKDSSNATDRHNARRRLQRLQQASEEAKKELSTGRATSIDVAAIYTKEGRVFDLKVPLTRSKFEKLNEELFTKTLQFVTKVLEEAKLTKTRVADIVLVGGSTRIPRVQAILQEYFQGKTLSKRINPDEAVAYGAAIQAAIMNGKISQESKHFNVIQDVCPMSLGIECVGKVFSRIVQKNTKVPTKHTHEYTTVSDNQTTIRITAFQGENDVAPENMWLGEFSITGIPSAPAGQELVDVTMEIDLQGVLHVTAVCRSTGGQNCIQVTYDKRRMSQTEIEKIREQEDAQAG